MEAFQLIYQTVLDSVCRVTGVECQLLLVSRLEECVDARCLLIYKLTQIGYSDTHIAKLTGFSQQRVNYLKNALSTRTRRFVFATHIKSLNEELDVLMPEHNDRKTTASGRKLPANDHHSPTNNLQTTHKKPTKNP